MQCRRRSVPRQSSWSLRQVVDECTPPKDSHAGPRVRPRDEEPSDVAKVSVAGRVVKASDLWFANVLSQLLSRPSW
jgi:hypothetical protein